MQFGERMGGVKVMNIAIQARSMVCMGGEMQVEHKQFGERMGGVMELGQMQFRGRTGEVTGRGGGGGGKNVVVQGRSPILVRGRRKGEQDSRTR